MANTFLFMAESIGFAPIIAKVIKEKLIVITDSFSATCRPDVIIADSNAYYDIVEESDVPIIGASRFGFQLDNADYKLKVLKACSLKYEQFPEGINICSEGWFSHNKFVTVVHSFFNTSFVGNTFDNLYKQGLGKLTKALSKLAYVGPISLNLFVNEEKIVANNIHAEINPITMVSTFENYKGKVSGFFLNLIGGIELHFKSRWHLALQVYAEPVLFPRFGINGINKQNLRHLWFYDVHHKNGQYTLGSSCNLGIITSRGDTARECCRRAYRTVNNLGFENKAYGRRWGTSIDEQYITLAEQKWIEGGDLDEYKKVVFEQGDLGRGDRSSGGDL